MMPGKKAYSEKERFIAAAKALLEVEKTLDEANPLVSTTVAELLTELNNLAPAPKPAPLDNSNPLKFLKNLLSAVNRWFTITCDRNLAATKLKLAAKQKELEAVGQWHGVKFPQEEPKSFVARLGEGFNRLLIALEYRLFSLKANYYGVEGYGAPTFLSKMLRFLSKPFNEAQDENTGPTLVDQNPTQGVRKVTKPEQDGSSTLAARNAVNKSDSPQSLKKRRADSDTR